ncbi:MAG: hypothetical protein ACEPOV_06860 [Hyphomicrobiales bacterium]
MKLKLRYKSLTSSLKKATLKLKEKLDLYPKQTSSTIQTYNEITAACRQETKITSINSINCTDIFFAISKNIQNRNNIAVRWFYFAIDISRAIKNTITILTIKVFPKQITFEDFISYKKITNSIIRNTSRESLQKIGQ